MRPLEARDILQRRLHCRFRLLEPRHQLGHVFDRLTQTASARLHGAHPLGLGLELRHAFRHAVELRRQGVCLRAHVSDRAARLGERPDLRLHVGQPATEIDDALPHRVEALVLKLEALYGPLDLVAQPREAAPQLLVGPLRFLVACADLLGALQHFAMERFELAHFGLELAQALRALLVLAGLGLHLAHEVVEVGHLAGGAFDDFPLLLERRHLLGDGVRERLERTELALRLGRVGRGLGQILQRLAERCHARLGRRDAALDLLLPLFEGVESRGDRFAGPAELLLAIAHPFEPLSDFAHPGPELVRIHAERLEPAPQLEEAGEVGL